MRVDVAVSVACVVGRLAPGVTTSESPIEPRQVPGRSCASIDPVHLLLAMLAVHTWLMGLEGGNANWVLSDP